MYNNAGKHVTFKTLNQQMEGGNKYIIGNGVCLAVEQ
jgi:hypothetical protein